MYVPTNPRGAESLPAGIVVSESDLYLHRLWGDPTEVWSVIRWVWNMELLLSAADN